MLFKTPKRNVLEEVEKKYEKLEALCFSFQEKIDKNKDFDIRYLSFHDKVVESFADTQTNFSNLSESISELTIKTQSQRKEIDDLKVQNKSLEELIKTLLESLQELSELNEIEEFKEEQKIRRKKDLEIQSKNFHIVLDKIKDTNQKTQKLNLDIKQNITELKKETSRLKKEQESILEVVAEKIVENEVENIDIFGQTSLRDILTKSKNKNKAALYAVVYLMKKELEDKGIKI